MAEVYARFKAFLYGSSLGISTVLVARFVVLGLLNLGLYNQVHLECVSMSKTLEPTNWPNTTGS